MEVFSWIQHLITTSPPIQQTKHQDVPHLQHPDPGPRNLRALLSSTPDCRKASCFWTQLWVSVHLLHVEGRRRIDSWQLPILRRSWWWCCVVLCWIWLNLPGSAAIFKIQRGVVIWSLCHPCPAHSQPQRSWNGIRKKKSASFIHVKVYSKNLLLFEFYL